MPPVSHTWITAIRRDLAPTRIKASCVVVEAPPILLRPLAYQHLLDQRPVGDIDLAVIHCTELPDLATARKFGETIRYPLTSTGNSGHFYINRNGHVEQWVEPSRVAHHIRGQNARSLGIELVNLGRYPNWLHSDSQQMSEVYPEKQIASLIALLDCLCLTLPSLQWISGHEDLDLERVTAVNDPSLTVSRKLDPGPLFPWSQLMKKVSLQRFKLPVTDHPS